MESTNTTPATEPKYQVKGTKTADPEDKKKSSRPSRGGRGGAKKESDKPAQKAIHMNSINLVDYANHDEAAEAISCALSTYASTSPEAIRLSVINYLKK